MSSDPRRDSPSSHKVKTAAVALPVALFMPFIVFWRSMRQIWGDQASRGILIMAALLLAAGTVLFMFIESLSLIDSFYFCFITLATIGYGDIAPQTDLGKTVTVVYGIAGLGVMAALISAIATHHRTLRAKQSEAAEAIAADGAEDQQ